MTQAEPRGRTRHRLTLPGRTEAFSDGVFAIAITLLVLELHVPHVNGSLLAALGRMWPTYSAYVVSFLTIGIIWINHHALFDRLIRLDRSLLFLNLVFLMTVSVLPFPTAILSEYLLASQGPTAAMIYSVNMAVMGSTFGAMWLYVARRRHLLANAETTEDYTGFLLRFSAGAPIYLLAAILALFDARITLAICAALAIYYVSLSTPGQLRHHTTGDPPASSSAG
jgi:uncharacterized membrane protein